MVPSKTFSPSIETEKYDIVVANILLNPLLDLAENIISYAKPGAIVALSGILSEQVNSDLQLVSFYTKKTRGNFCSFKFEKLINKMLINLNPLSHPFDVM